MGWEKVVEMPSKFEESSGTLPFGGLEFEESNGTRTFGGLVIRTTAAGNS